MPRKSKEQALTLGFIGNGELSANDIASTLDDFIGQRQDVTFVLPVTKDGMKTSIKAVADWAIENDVPFQAVTDKESDGVRALGKYLKAAAKTHPPVQRVSQKLLNILTSASGEVALVGVWVDPNEATDDDEELDVIVALADDKEIVVRSLNAALEEVEFAEDDEAESDGTDESDESDESDDTDEAKGDDADDDEDWTPYTEAELSEKDAADLKAILAEEWEEEVPPRTRATTMVKRILELQEEFAADDEGDEGDEADEDEAEGDEEQPKAKPKTEKAAPVEDDDDEDDMAPLTEEEIDAIADAVASKVVEAIVPALTGAFGEFAEGLEEILSPLVEAVAQQAQAHTPEPTVEEDDDEDEEEAPAPARRRPARRRR